MKLPMFFQPSILAVFASLLAFAGFSLAGQSVCLAQLDAPKPLYRAQVPKLTAMTTFDLALSFMSVFSKDLGDVSVGNAMESARR